MRETDRRQRRERESDCDRKARCRGTDRSGTREIEEEQLPSRHPERPQCRVRRGRKACQPQDRRSEQQERKQRAEPGREPERLRLMIDRALDLARVVGFRPNVPTGIPPERGDVGRAVPELDRDREVRVAAGEAVHAVERGRQRDGPDRVRIGRRLDPHDPQPYQRPDRNGLRERLDDVPAEPRLERPGKPAGAQAERQPVERWNRLAPLDPQLSAGLLGVGEVRIALREAAEARALAQTKVEPVDRELRPTTSVRAVAREQDHPDLAPLRYPGLHRILVPRIAVEDGEVARVPAGEHANRDHAAGAGAEPLGGARVEQHFAWPAGLGDAAREQLGLVQRDAVSAVEVHEELDRLRAEQADRAVLRVASAVGEQAADGRGLDVRKGAHAPDRRLVGRVVGAGVADADPRVRVAERDQVARE